ncbi:hypothetical protein BsWGS_26343 [Bradybaena similaris]
MGKKERRIRTFQPKSLSTDNVDHTSPAVCYFKLKYQQSSLLFSTSNSYINSPVLLSATSNLHINSLVYCSLLQTHINSRVYCSLLQTYISTAESTVLYIKLISTV